jgi:putative ABC transport system permease protein
VVNYIELQAGANPKAVEKAIADLIRKNAPEQTVKNLSAYLMPLNNYNLVAQGGIVKRMCYTLGCIALFILLMAVINFVNICIGRSSGRMKEMGIRKVLGGLRKQLIWQFLTESVLMVAIATVIALILYLPARPYFGAILGQEITGLFAFPVYFMLIPVTFALLVGVLAGIYPALVLSALKSIDSLKGKLGSVKESVLFRKTLVAFQFATAAMVFIVLSLFRNRLNFSLVKAWGTIRNTLFTRNCPGIGPKKGYRKWRTSVTCCRKIRR